MRFTPGTLSADIFYNARLKLLFLLVVIAPLALACNEGIVVGVRIRSDTPDVVVVGRCGYENECGKKLMDRTVLEPGDDNFGVNAARGIPVNVRIQSDAGNDIGCLQLDYAELTPMAANIIIEKCLYPTFAPAIEALGVSA